MYFENTVKNNLKELVEILLDEKMAHLNLIKIESYVKNNETALKNVKELQEIVVLAEIRSLIKSNVAISKKDWDSLIREFEEHLKKIEFKEINDPKDKVSKKALELNRFIKKKIEDFISMKGGTK